MAAAHFVCFLFLVTDSDWRSLVWVGFNALAQNDGYFGLTRTYYYRIRALILLVL
jgi:hypothetical protein